MLNVKLFGGEAPRGQTITAALASVILNLSSDMFRDVRALWRQVTSLNEKGLTAFGQQGKRPCLAKQDTAVIRPQFLKTGEFVVHKWTRALQVKQVVKLLLIPESHFTCGYIAQLSCIEII